MDQKKILLINLSKGLLGEDNANLLGSMLTTKLYLTAMSRADVGKYNISKLPNFYLYIDEFQNIVNESFASILAEARKYRLSLIMAHQYINNCRKMYGRPFSETSVQPFLSESVRWTRKFWKNYSPQLFTWTI